MNTTIRKNLIINHEHSFDKSDFFIKNRNIQATEVDYNARSRSKAKKPQRKCLINRVINTLKYGILQRMIFFLGNFAGTLLNTFSK